MVLLKNVIRSILRESDSCWGEHLKKTPPNVIIVKNLPDIKFAEYPLYGIETDFGRVEYGVSVATYVNNAVHCTIYFDELINRVIPEHIASILTGIVIGIINKEGALSGEEANIRNSIFGKIEGKDNWVKNAAIQNDVLHCVLKHKTIIRQLYIKSKEYNDFPELNLFLYLIHHEANHCASALLTWRRGACSLNAWAEILVDFCTFLEVNDFFVDNESKYDYSNKLTIYHSKQKHMKFVEYIIERARKNGKSQEEIFEAIWRYCFDKHIEGKEARKILSNDLSMCERNIVALEKKKKIDDVIKYCNSNISDFKFIDKENLIVTTHNHERIN